MKLTSNGLWKYLTEVNKLDTMYMTGQFGQKSNTNKYMYDCVCLIKSYAWCDGKAGNTPTYKSNGVSDDWIGTIYDKATDKSTDMSKLLKKKTGIYCVYLNNEHIGIYNAKTGTTIECCGGNTNRTIERPISFYDTTPYKWNKWSNLYWVDNTDVVEQPVQPVVDQFINYTVQRGDSLWGISCKYYSTGTKYPIIMTDNNLKNTEIYQGQILKIRK